MPVFRPAYLLEEVRQIFLFSIADKLESIVQTDVDKSLDMIGFQQFRKSSSLF